MNIEEILIGENKFQAKRIAKYNGYEFRIVREDGVDYAITDDFKINRVNVELINDKIIKAHVG